MEWIRDATASIHSTCAPVGSGKLQYLAVLQHCPDAIESTTHQYSNQLSICRECFATPTPEKGEYFHNYFLVSRKLTVYPCIAPATCASLLCTTLGCHLRHNCHTAYPRKCPHPPKQKSPTGCGALWWRELAHQQLGDLDSIQRGTFAQVVT